MRFQGVLFDLDGTLVNSNELIYQSFEYALAEVLHTTLPRQTLTATFGKPLQQIMDELGGSQAEQLRQAFVAYTLAHEDQLCAFPGAAETLRRLKELQIRVALVTSRLRHGAVRDLKLLQLDHYFDVLITPESTAQHKPHPAPALQAAAALGLQPQQTLMVGDSSHDLLCGAAAGCKTVVVDYSLVDPAELQRCNPDYHIQALPQLIDLVTANNSES